MVVKFTFQPKPYKSYDYSKIKFFQKETIIQQQSGKKNRCSIKQGQNQMNQLDQSIFLEIQAIQKFFVLTFIDFISITIKSESSENFCLNLVMIQNLIQNQQKFNIFNNKKGKMSCTYHIQNPIAAICIAPHKCQCQRKLCMECAYSHGVDFKQTIPIQIFQEMLIKKQKESKPYETSDFTKERTKLKLLLSQTESTMNKIWENFQESIKSIYDMIELQDKTYLEILNNNTTPVELSNTDLEMLVQILVGDKLKGWNALKDFNLRKIEKVQNLLGQEIKAFNEQIIKKMNETLKLEFTYKSYTNLLGYLQID
ncbi:unnamed protein product [Paramecium sonneborni]|uniref:Uncharacterized protein n=1 Tax=Paramecium sonneborni TaxID=65129 RepID=A0A8S1M3R3_9CILI|nr:unnamed protein product [Paramecium sonneborni]